MVLVAAQGVPRIFLLDTPIHLHASHGIRAAEALDESEVDIAEFLVPDALRLPHASQWSVSKKKPPPSRTLNLVAHVLQT